MYGLELEEAGKSFKLKCSCFPISYCFTIWLVSDTKFMFTRSRIIQTLMKT